MDCAEFQGLLPEIIDGNESGESKSHAGSCAECAALFVELKEISDVARLLRAGEEPNQRVWNSLEIALRQEGLIHETTPARPTLVPDLGISRWKMGWLVPVAALLLVMSSGVVVYQRNLRPQPAGIADTASINNAPVEDQEILQEVATRTPSLSANYKAGLDHINSYIHTAEDTVKANPTDENAQHALMEAYEQRAMVYEMAFERPVQ